MSRESSSRGPAVGLIRLNKPYGSWRRVATANRKRETAEISTRRPVIDGRTL